VLITYMRGHNELNSLVPTWPPACLHSAKTIGRALLESKSPCSRFSSPMLSPQSVLGAASNPPSTLGILAERLTCLELHFDDSTDLDVRMRHLTSLSKALFTAAKNIEAVHIGFPSYRPLTLRLEELFHNVKWEKLQGKLCVPSCEPNTDVVSLPLQLSGSKPGVSTQMKYWVLLGDTKIHCVVCASEMYF